MTVNIDKENDSVETQPGVDSETEMKSLKKMANRLNNILTWVIVITLINCILSYIMLSPKPTTNEQQPTVVIIQATTNDEGELVADDTPECTVEENNEQVEPAKTK